MKLAMIGAGYVGLTTGACLAELGHHVVVFDIARDRVAQLRRAALPIFEPGLDRLVHKTLSSGRLSFTDCIKQAIENVQAVFIAVGTPSLDDGDIDLSQIDAAAHLIAANLDPQTVIVIKSTVAVGTAGRVREIVAEKRGKADFFVASNPEFLREGSAISDFMRPDRIVLGYDDEQAGDVLDAIYAPLAGVAPVCRTSTADAELTKHTANAFLAMKICFANQVADLCEAVGGDVNAVMEAVGRDSRIGRSFLNPGPGYGGSCFPKDTRAFAHTGRSKNAPQSLIESVIATNVERPARLSRRILSQAGLMRGDAVALLGVAFKANTDDVRESPSMEIARELTKAGIRVHVHDPQAMPNARRVLGHEVDWFDNPMDALSGVDAAVVATEWDDYRRLDLRRAAECMCGRHLFDFRNLLDPAKARHAGLVYHSIGRATVNFKSDGAQRAVWSRGGVLPFPAAAGRP
ncbi:MAG: UDP-glucose/GDP-mannose dehydrogenase family protein [Aquamicrobium sp.]|nr:UDP-glucose/GDP-mannose dehydrogenase family protein [Aquamicrobium sp.]